jgi:TetR/AcrR family transcriptional repressor of bet genes
MQASDIFMQKMNEYSFILWHDSSMAAKPQNTKRTQAREKRRQQLINATMKCIARKGMGSTTLGDVASEAGLSQGIVNLHFQSKENLLTETLRFLSDDYKTQFDATLDKSGPGAASKLRAVTELDLHRSILDRSKLAVWFAFWSEVKSRPTYQEICEQTDEYYDNVIRALCSQVIVEGKYKSVTASAVSTVLTSMTNGMWLSYLISPKHFDRRGAMRAIDEYLHSIFPNHFPL